MAINLNKENYTVEVEQSTLPVVIDVYATWCGPCQMMLPIFEEVSKELSDKYKFVKLNIDESRELAFKFGISSVPTFVFIKNGKISKETGYMNKEAFIQKIEELLG
ncbi:TPA: thioredoxin [Candidatus Dependentiae bacterium]|nr:MAG: Thioredoxin [candidate division TM6 bacterium GW2011_GWE2_31_21]KKP53808.1 MAG: Thioredoxin [candidate division TM6 bacterium GW2011_GWF2_33_332]HBS47588.1 thioredoxin [Candidatus Dependentiae bacterium]HBZ73737.1 thioredoxin [Candidatus Dependentiae bacterium]